MSNLESRVQELVARVKKTEKLKIQNEVIHDQTIAQLKRDYGVDNFEDAEDLLVDLKKKRKALTKRLEKAVDTFEEKHGECLDDLGV